MTCVNKLHSWNQFRKYYIGYFYLGLTAIEAWVIVCVLFVFGALIEYAGVLLKIKLGAARKKQGFGSVVGSRSASRENSIVVNNGNTMAEELTKQVTF